MKEKTTNNEELKEGIDYKLDKNGNIVWAREYLKNRGYCCGDGCIYCPYVPKHQEGNKTLAPEGDYYGNFPG